MSVHRSCRSAGWVSVALLLVGLIGITGCGNKGRLPTYKVNGSVTADNAPAERAIVIFCPVDPGPELGALRPYGITDSEGKFKLFTFNPGDGAPAGDYKVLIKWPSQGRATDLRDAPPPGAVVYNGPDRLKGKYYNIEKTPLSVTIEKKTNDLPPFNLQTK